MAISILALAFTLLMGFFAYKCQRGCDWILLSGVNTLPKEDRDEYRATHDMIGMNKLAGRRIFRPMAVVSALVLFVNLFGLWSDSAAFGVAILVVTVILLTSVFSALPRILGTEFEKK
jgi:hypothetical protein